MSFRRPIVLASVVAAGTFTGGAVAYVCHPGAAGTRMLTLHGSVVSLKARGAGYGLVLKQPSGRCTRISWNVGTGASESLAVGCPAPSRLQASIVGPLAAGTAQHRLIVTRGAGTAPDLLKVYDRGSLLRTLPLPARPQTLESSRGIAVFSAKGAGVFAMRLSDGLYGYLGPDGGAFAPMLDLRGVVFHDGESKAALRDGATVLEFVPRSAIAKIIARTSRPLVTGGPINSISMDGPRVALAVGDTRRLCDRVLYWNVAWWPAQRISSPSGVTCMVRPHGIAIPAVAIGGFRAEWVTTQRGGARLIAGSPLCQEWVLGRFSRGSQVTGLAGDGSMLVFATTIRGRTTVARVNGRYRPVTIAMGAGVPRIAADGKRVAVLWPDGTVAVGARSFHVGTARAIALQGDELVALTRGRLQVFSVSSGRRIHSWAVPAATRAVDLQDHVAAFASGPDAVVLDTATGRTATVAHGGAPLTAVQIEGPGLALAWTAGSKGVARFITTRTIDLALGRLAA
jgi:hypothetical protein